MKKIICMALCLMLLFSNQLIFASEENYLDIDALSCDEIKITYYNGGEFSNPIMPGYYTYVTTDSAEIEDILNSLSNVKLTPFNGGWGGSGGEWLTIYVDGEMVVSFCLSGAEKHLCRTSDKSYYFSIEECRRLEEVVQKYKTKNDTKVYLDNEEIKFYNSPVIVNDRALVPAQNISTQLGLTVRWDNNRVIFIKDAQSLVVYTDDTCIFENGSRKSIDVGCKLIDDIAMVPVRLLAEYYGFTVKWENNSVYILTE